MPDPTAVFPGIVERNRTAGGVAMSELTKAVKAGDHRSAAVLIGTIQRLDSELAGLFGLYAPERVEVVRAAMGLARDAAEGQLDAGALDADLIAQCCALVGLVVGPSDPLWSLQLDVCRQVLAAGGLPLTELAEWCAVLQARQDAPEAVESLGVARDKPAGRLIARHSATQPPKRWPPAQPLPLA